MVLCRCAHCEVADLIKPLGAAAWFALAAWTGLAFARGRFWDASADRLRQPSAGDPAPDVHAVVPARNEADVVARTLAALLAQDYAGRFDVTVVDDRSDDGTAGAARHAIARAGARHGARVIAARPRPAGWTGKVWALAEGVAAARAAGARPAFWWFSDADVEHDASTLARLVATAHAERRALVSQMVALHCATPAERLLIPAFVFFFRMLYPFAWVNDDARSTAAAAGGCVLLRDDTLARIGGIGRIRGELIDDCALAAAVKGEGGGLWLGLATRSRSVRPYGSSRAIWSMVARTAYTQLRYSPLLLAGTLAGMLLLYGVPVVATVCGLRAGRASLAAPGIAAWLTMAALYAPTLRLYGVRRRAALLLPAAALLYTAMTLDSAREHAGGAGGAWKGRTFTPARR
ncbi:MAG TPA: glycosyltransferase [Candidatus Elarobacter sp.]|jgi:hopene-associated glycosyltransferase HpnB|nr:glycosyltransferase [Candidatus Elarobacter sp.]